MKNSVSFIGAGRVTTQMAIAFKEAGIPILQIYSRKLENAQKLTQQLKAGEAIDSLEDFKDESTLSIIAVADDAIEMLANKLNLKQSILTHTSGSIPLEALKNGAVKTAIFYPLQSFQIDKKPDWEEIPFFLESKDESLYQTLEFFAKKLSKTVNRLDSEKRKQLHLAAVFANNFPNFLYHISYKILEEKGLKFEYLIPLLKEMSQRLDGSDPLNAQTGPARRGDIKTIEKHIEMLEGKEDFQKIYQQFSDLILEKFNHKK